MKKKMTKGFKGLLFGSKKKSNKLSTAMVILIVAVSVLGAILLVPYEINTKKEKGWEIKSLLLKITYDKNAEGRRLSIRPFA